MKVLDRTFSATIYVVFFGAILIFCACSGVLEPIVKIPYYLFTGWFHYLLRVVPQIKPEPATVATAIACLAVVVFGVHGFARWLYRAMAPNEKPVWSWRWTARIVSVIVLMFTVGIAAVGITHQSAWLAISDGPFFSGRRIKEQMVSANYLKQLGLAVNNVAESNQNVLPADTSTRDGKPLHSWQTSLLPFLEQDETFKKLKLDRPWNHPDNREAINTRIRVFLHPAVENEKTATGLPATHYAANALSFGGDQPRKLTDYAKGTSNTILIGEAVRNSRSWADPLGGRDPRLGLNHPNGFGGPSKQKSTQFIMADGSVRTLNLAEIEELLNQ